LPGFIGEYPVRTAVRDGVQAGTTPISPGKKKVPRFYQTLSKFGVWNRILFIIKIM